MFSRIVAFSVFLAVATASQYGHGHAVSSQSITRHVIPINHGYHHDAYASNYAAPIAHYAAPIAHYATPIAHYAAPIPHYAAPIAHYAAPIAHYAAPIPHYAAPIDHYNGYDTHAHPKYDYSYSVSDPHTGDYKSQHESRNGDAVHGYYSLAQPDGTLSKVEYTAGHNGFNAIVHNTAPSEQPHTYSHGYSHGYGYGY